MVVVGGQLEEATEAARTGHTQAAEERTRTVNLQTVTTRKKLWCTRTRAQHLHTQSIHSRLPDWSFFLTRHMTVFLFLFVLFAGLFLFRCCDVSSLSRD